MNKNRIWGYVQLLAPAVTVCMFGLLLLTSPDTASALVGMAFGVVLLATGIGFAVAGIVRRRLTYGLGGVVLLILGTMLVREPLALASGLGRIVGVLLLAQSLRELFLSNYGHGKALCVVTAVLGLVLTLLPMATSRMVFRGVGAVLLIVGIMELVERLRYDRIDSGKNGDIIDAE